MKPLVDVAAAFALLLSEGLAIQITVLLILFLFTLVRIPKDVEIEFPAPTGIKHQPLTEKARPVEVPQYPTCRDISFLILLYLVDIVLLYPYTLESREERNLLLLQLVSIVVFPLQVAAAHGWGSISPSWLAAQRRHGLWHSNAWRLYYMSFILTGVAIGLLIMGRGIALIILQLIALLPAIWRAQCHAFLPLKSLEGPFRTSIEWFAHAS